MKPAAVDRQSTGQGRQGLVAELVVQLRAERERVFGNIVEKRGQVRCDWHDIQRLHFGFRVANQLVDQTELIIHAALDGLDRTRLLRIGQRQQLYGVQQVQFDDGTTLSLQQLINASLASTTGSDSLYGGPGAELFDGQGGGDFELGNGGADTFVFDAGYGSLEINESIFSTGVQ